MATFLTLDREGLFVALVMGLLLLGFGQAEGPFFLFVILVFLALSAVVTRFGEDVKKKAKTFEVSRGWKNVAANGLVPLLIAFVYFVDLHYGFVWKTALVVAYVSSIAAITADKFSSEIGVLDSRVIMLVTLKRIKPGVSGGVSVLGMMAGVLASYIIGLCFFQSSVFGALLPIVTVAGVFGDIVDSLFGFLEVRGIGNKYSSNILGALAGGIAGVLLFSAFFVV